MGLNVEAVALRRGGTTVLDGVTAAFAPGRVTALLGPNGAGKTTLLRIAAGLIRPDAGAATLDGAAIASMDRSARARAIGYLPQSASVAWDVTVRELVSLGRSPHRTGPAADAAAIDHALAACDLTLFADRTVGTLSGGERARVMLARVLAGEPRWILADEPLASLDPAHQRSVLALLRAAARAGAGVVIVLHELAHAARIADDALLLSAGRLVALGPVANVLTADRLEAVYGIPFEVGESATHRRVEPRF